MKGLLNLVLVVVFICNIQAREKPGNTNGLLKSNSAMGTPSQSIMNIGNFLGWITNDGMGSSDPFSGGSGAFYPKSTAAVIYIDGMVWGGIVQDPNTDKPQLRVGGQTYRVGTQPGKILSLRTPYPSQIENAVVL